MQHRTAAGWRRTDGAWSASDTPLRTTVRRHFDGTSISPRKTCLRRLLAPSGVRRFGRQLPPGAVTGGGDCGGQEAADEGEGGDAEQGQPAAHAAGAGEVPQRGQEVEGSGRVAGGGAHGFEGG